MFAIWRGSSIASMRVAILNHKELECQEGDAIFELNIYRDFQEDFFKAFYFGLSYESLE